MIDWALSKLGARESLDMQQMSDVMHAIMEGSCDEASIVQLLSRLHEKGETVDELAGAAKALQQKMTTLDCPRRYLIDTCGTGGSGKHVFNISTAAALVTAGAGATVAKHGNRAITGSSGSADVLQALGVNIDASLAATQRCLVEAGICFCFAPLFHPSVRHASAARKQLKHPTIFNLLGPLCNPARARHQLLGAGRGETRRLLAKALQRLGTTRSAVVHGQDGIGEVTIGGETLVSVVTPYNVAEFTWTTDELTVKPASLAEIQVNGPEESAKMIGKILDNEPGPPLEIVVANTAASLWLVGLVQSLGEGAELARKTLRDGRARQVLNRLVELSHAPP